MGQVNDQTCLITDMLITIDCMFSSLLFAFSFKNCFFQCFGSGEKVKESPPVPKKAAEAVSSQTAAAVKPTGGSSSSPVWECNIDKVWKPYADNDSSIIDKHYRTSPNTHLKTMFSFSADFKTEYVIDFDKMVQTNTETKVERHIRWRNGNQTAIWQCCVDGKWTAYNSSDTSLLTQEYSKSPSGKCETKLSFSGHPYTIDFARMVQINQTTKVERSIRAVPTAHNVSSSATPPNVTPAVTSIASTTPPAPKKVAVPVSGAAPAAAASGPAVAAAAKGPAAAPPPPFDAAKLANLRKEIAHFMSAENLAVDTALCDQLDPDGWAALDVLVKRVAIQALDGTLPEMQAAAALGFDDLETRVRPPCPPPTPRT
jgi:hypothetical protein